MTWQKTKPATVTLYVLLVLTMSIPSNVTVFAQSNTVDTDIKQNAYLNKLLQQKEVQNMTAEQQNKFIQKVYVQFTSTPYQKQVLAMFEELVEIELQINDSKISKEDTAELTQKLWAIVYDLENYGIVSEEKYLANPGYWMERALAAMQQVNQDKTVSANINNTGYGNIKQASMDEVVLRNISEVRVPCLGILSGVIIFVCPNYATDYGLDTKTGLSFVASMPGTLYMAAHICVDDAGSNNFITPTYNYHQKVSSVIGTDLKLYEGTKTVTLGDGNCSVVKNSYSGLATTGPGSMAHSYTYVHQTVSFA